MSSDHGQHEHGCHANPVRCEREFRALNAKLDHLDEAIRGNGRLGLVTRVDRIEQMHASRSRLMWVVVGALASAGAAVLLQLFQLMGSP